VQVVDAIPQPEERVSQRAHGVERRRDPRAGNGVNHAVRVGHTLIEQTHDNRRRGWWMFPKGIHRCCQCALMILAACVRQQMFAALKCASCSLGELQQVHGTSSHMFFGLSYNRRVAQPS
jgi:hypothetical protein